VVTAKVKEIFKRQSNGRNGTRAAASAQTCKGNAWQLHCGPVHLRQQLTFPQWDNHTSSKEVATVGKTKLKQSMGCLCGVRLFGGGIAVVGCSDGNGDAATVATAISLVTAMPVSNFDSRRINRFTSA